jgi:hypothetical protein
MTAHGSLDHAKKQTNKQTNKKNNIASCCCMTLFFVHTYDHWAISMQSPPLRLQLRRKTSSRQLEKILLISVLRCVMLRATQQLP